MKGCFGAKRMPEGITSPSKKLNQHSRNTFCRRYIFYFIAEERFCYTLLYDSARFQNVVFSDFKETTLFTSRNVRETTFNYAQKLNRLKQPTVGFCVVKTLAVVMLLSSLFSSFSFRYFLAMQSLLDFCGKCEDKA